MTTPTGFLYDTLFLQHNAGRQTYHGVNGPADAGAEFDCPERLAYTKALLDATGMTARLQPLAYQPANDATLLRVHTPAYLAQLAANCAAADGDGVALGPDARGGPATERIARAAAGAACAAVDAVLQGQVGRAYALIRPLAVAARHAQAQYGLQRVAIIDWDVHHGNGTQHVFEADPQVLFCSLHEEGNYPLEGGSEHDQGQGAGAGYTVNIPLPAGSGYAAYALAFGQVLLPVLRRFRPELILVSAGQDANAYDPLGRMRLTRPGYRALAASLTAAAGELCQGRIVMLQEGGYSLPYLPIATLGVIEGLSGQQVDFDDPHWVPDRPLAAAEAAAVARARDAQGKYWALQGEQDA